MAPLREISNWTNRYDYEYEIKPKRRYYVITEGSRTERKYFEIIDDNRERSKINSLLDIVFLTNSREVSLLLAYLAHEVRAQAGDESVAFD